MATPTGLHERGGVVDAVYTPSPPGRVAGARYHVGLLISGACRRGADRIPSSAATRPAARLLSPVTSTGPMLPGPPPVSPAVVLTHGIVSTRYLLPTARWLAYHRPVVAPDLPGFGASARPRHHPTIGELAHIASAAVDELGLAKPVLVGHSIGVHVAVELALRGPDVVSGLVLVGPTGPHASRRCPRCWRAGGDGPEQAPPVQRPRVAGDRRGRSASKWSRRLATPSPIL